jgi:adenylate cyclase
VLNASWNTRDGLVVPKTEDVALKDGAVKIDATYLYADLAGSSEMAQKLKKTVTAKIIRTYINSASRILRWKGGAIRSFDGDRVMAIFIGDSKNTSAVRAALAINWAVVKVIWPKVKETWPTITDFYSMDHGIGVATGEALIVRGGVRDNNDLVSIGEAPNVAAKLSDIRSYKTIYIAADVYNNMHKSVTYADATNMWSSFASQTIGGKSYAVYATSYHWEP